MSISGNVVNPETIYQNLKEIINDPSPPPRFPIGVLTSEERDTWAGLRNAISAIPANHESLKLIDSALFALCLDDSSPTDPVELTQVMLHGDGANRFVAYCLYRFKEKFLRSSLHDFVSFTALLLGSSRKERFVTNLRKRT